MIIVYSGKPQISRAIAPGFLEKYPSKKIVYIHAMYFMNVSFDYPKNVKWKSFPHLSKPVFKINDIEHWRASTLIEGELKPIKITFQDVRQCEQIIYAGDPCPSESYLFSEFIEAVFNKKPDSMPINAIFLLSFSPLEIFKSIESMSAFSPKFNESVNQGRVKKYFDYNYNFNSFAILGKAYRHTNKIFNGENNPTNLLGNIFISKNMLQLLYFVKKEQENNIRYKTNFLISQMHHWKGTGKYDFQAYNGHSASAYPIIENLTALKLIDYDNKEIFITQKGLHFLSLLPKGAMDLDLPFRLKLWAKEPFEDSKIKIDNYLSSYFKKIKNKLKSFNIQE